MAKKTAVKKPAARSPAARKAAPAKTAARKAPAAGSAKTASTKSRKTSSAPMSSTPKKSRTTMTTRKPTASKSASGKTPAAPAKAGTKPAASAGGKPAAAAKPAASPAAKAGAPVGGKPAASPGGKAAAAPVGGKPAAASGGKPAAPRPGAAPGKNGPGPAGKAPAGKGGKPVRDESRTPASLARAAMQSAEKAREAAKPRKSPYNKAQLLPLRKSLLETRTRLISDLNQMEKEALRADDADVDVENVADHGTDAFERNMTLGLMEGEARTLRQIGEALDAIEAGRYGLCTACGEAIPIARLEALPFASTCVPCQEAQERRM
jgi:RNA polymerase-binding protein DksA